MSEWIIDRRYQVVKGEHIFNEKGRWLAQRGWFWRKGWMDLAVKVGGRYPTNPITGRPYIEAGLVEDILL